MKNKYQPLERFLLKQKTDRVSMRFDEIESLIGERLPPSAYKHRPWWANEIRGHSHAKAWLDADYEASEVDMNGRKLTFIKVGGSSSSGARGGVPQPSSKSLPGSKSSRHPAIGLLKGLLVIAAGHDLTAPAAPDWADMDSNDGPERSQ